MECKKNCNPCDNPQPVFDVGLAPSSATVVRYNVNGITRDLNHEGIVKAAETDTSLYSDAIKRYLKFTAEKHIDIISARELGSILHLTDIGDVSKDDVKDGSFLLYQKNNECGEGCIGIANRWISHHPMDWLRDDLQYIMGVNANGQARTLNHPVDTTKQYFLGWDAQNKIRYFRPAKVTSKPRTLLGLDDNGNLVAYTETE